MKVFLYKGVVLMAMLVLSGCDEKLKTTDQVKKLEIKTSLINQTTEKVISEVEENEKTPLILTNVQKEEYHKQYIKIVEKVRQQKLGMQPEVAPIGEFREEDWVTPDVFEQRIQKSVVEFMTEERKALKAIQTERNLKVKKMKEGWTAEKTIYVAGLLSNIEVVGDFEMQYSKAAKSQVIKGVKKISTRVATGSKGTWKQTSYKVTLLDGGRTYSIRIEGIHNYNGLSVEKAFIIKYHVDNFGNILVI